jgi:SAM-dependent methyltransferase
MSFSNAYNDGDRATAYAAVDEFKGTYYLAFRDLPSIISEHVTGKSALDFGCGSGRSSRFLKRLGFEVVGIDISESMVKIASDNDKEGVYHVAPSGDFSILGSQRFDLILCCMPFDNIPDASNRTQILRNLGNFLADHGKVIIISATRETYQREWVSLSTKDFPDNALAKSGDPVKIVMTDGGDSRPITDFAWTHEDYVRMGEEGGFRVIGHYLPLGKEEEPIRWITETKIAPWFTLVLQK